MKNLETEIIINANQEIVWNILMNHKVHPNWNPFIKSISGNAQEGSIIDVTIQPIGKNPMRFKPLILKNKKLNEFRWKGHLFVKGLFDGEHYFRLEKLSKNKTRFVHGEEFSGLLSATLLKMIGENTKASFMLMNEALKKEAEK